MAISLQVCNLALSEIRAPAIASIDEKSIEARECARFYPMCLQSMLEMHEWSYATATVALAQVANDRPTEWVYAYQLPLDCGVVRNLIGTALPVSGVFFPWPYNEPRPSGFWSDYIVEAGMLYTNQAGAVLEYSRNDIEQAQMPMLFRHALALDIASYLAVSIRDDSRLKGELIQQAEIAKQRAMAADMNRHPRRDWPHGARIPIATGVPFGLETKSDTVSAAAPIVVVPPSTASLDFSVNDNSQYIALIFGRAA